MNNNHTTVTMESIIVGSHVRLRYGATAKIIGIYPKDNLITGEVISLDGSGERWSTRWDAAGRHGLDDSPYDIMTNGAEELSDDHDGRLGCEIAQALDLRRDPEHPDRWVTHWGTKTNRGLARTLRHILNP
jgi:hypothetical protein